MYFLNQPNQWIGFSLISSTDGSPVPGATVTVWIAINGGSQFLGSGTIKDLGNGQYFYGFVASETNGNNVSVTFQAPGCIEVEKTILPFNDGGLALGLVGAQGPTGATGPAGPTFLTTVEHTWSATQTFTSSGESTATIAASGGPITLNGSFIQITDDNSASIQIGNKPTGLPYALSISGGGGTQLAGAVVIDTSGVFQSYLGWNGDGSSFAAAFEDATNAVLFCDGTYAINVDSGNVNIGTVTGGTWQGNTIAVEYGGTGTTTGPTIPVSHNGTVVADASSINFADNITDLGGVTWTITNSSGVITVKGVASVTPPP